MMKALFLEKSRSLSILLLLAICPVQAFSETVTGRVVKVADGDTLTVLDGKKQVKIRLYGVDCPEKRQAYGQKAKDFTEDAAAGKNVRVDILGHDRYGRKIGNVLVNGKSLSLSLVKNGLAWVYEGFCKKSFCAEWKKEESLARKKRIGLWKDKSPTPPWEWRKR